MADFILLLYDDPSNFSGLAPEEMQKIVEEYTAWATEMGDQGKYTGGQKLMDEGGRLLCRDSSGGGGILVKDGPYSETKEVIAGFMQIKADSYDDAVEIARTCPHLKYGPKIELRQIDPIHE